MRISDAFVESLLKDTLGYSEEDISVLRRASLETKKPLQDLVVQHDLMSEADLARAYAEAVDLPFVDLPPEGVSARFLARLPQSVARRHSAVVFSVDEDGTALVAIADPSDATAVDYLNKHLGDIKLHVTSPSRLKAALNQYAPGPVMSHSSMAYFAHETSDLVDHPSITESLNHIIQGALLAGSSYIHIEPQDDHVLIRWRIDGRLREGYKLPHSSLTPLLAYIKSLADIQLHEHSTHQNGNWRLTSSEQSYEIRVSIVPTINGEKALLHIVPMNAPTLGLPALGLWGNSLRQLRQATTHSRGVVFVAGPRRSGKATTLLELIHVLKTSDTSVLTIEERPKYRVDGIQQLHLEFATLDAIDTMLKSVQNQDPDIIMVNIAQDVLAGSSAIQTAASGHVVLSSLHAGSAAGALRHLLDIGIEPFMLLSTVRAVVGQRLIRVLCSNCRESFALGRTQMSQLNKLLDSYDISWRQLHELEKSAVMAGIGSDPKGGGIQDLSTTNRTIKYLWRAHQGGCEMCNYTGYRGQTGIFEVLVPQVIEKSINRKQSTDELGRAAIKAGMMSLRLDGLIKALRGQISFAEVLKVLGSQ